MCQEKEIVYSYEYSIFKDELISIVFCAFTIQNVHQFEIT